MKILGNIIWLVFGGIIIAIEYFIGSLILMITIVGIPFGLQTLKMGSLSIWPFGRTSRVEPQPSGCLYVFMNVLWLLCGGIWIALSHAFFGVLLYHYNNRDPIRKSAFQAYRSGDQSIRKKNYAYLRYEVWGTRYMVRGPGYEELKESNICENLRNLLEKKNYFPLVRWIYADKIIIYDRI